MQSDDSQRAAVRRLVLRLSRLLNELLQEVDIGVGDFLALAKLSAVQAVRVADRNAGRPPPTISRIAVKSGLSRNEVSKLIRLREHPPSSPRRRMRARADRVLSAWKTDETFLNEFKKPALLAVHGPEPSFAGLVRQHSGTSRVEPILNEVLYTKAVEKTVDGRLRLVRDTCVNVHWDEESIDSLSADLVRHFEVGLHNLRDTEGRRQFVRSFESDALDPEQIKVLLRRLSDRGGLLLEIARELLSRKEYAYRQGSRDQGPPRRIAIAIQIVDEPASSAASSTRRGRPKQESAARRRSPGGRRS